MKRPSRKQIVLILFAALLIGVGGLVYWGQHRKRSTELYYSGTIEATTSNLAFQVSGRVKEILVDEGQSVTDGQVLVRLEQDEFLARRNQADANLNQAQESLNQLKTMFELQQATLPAEVKRAEAAVRSLGFQLKELESGYRSQEVEAVRLAMEEAQASLEEAQREKARFDSLFERKVVSKREKEDKDLRYQTALKIYGRAVESYNMSKEGFRREFERVAQWFGPFSDQAIRERTYLIDKLVERF